MNNLEKIEKQIEILVSQYAIEKYLKKEFVEGKSNVAISGKVFDHEEIFAIVQSALDFNLTTGKFNSEFEDKLSKFLGVKYALTCNSGSSANLLALTALTSPVLKDRALKPKDEVITVAASFPTTVNPIIQNNLVPVFLDVTIPSYNIDVSMLESALSERTKAIMIAHTLGNPFDLNSVLSFAKKHNLWVIEDCCDALGSLYGGRKCGSFGDIATFSFYPAHHITMGEGGAVVTDNPTLKKSIESFRDWGRDCFCHPGCDNTCGRRFGMHIGELPEGYDHKYTYSHLGYNLKITDMQAAVGVAQFGKLESFIEKRKTNFRKIKDRLKQFEKYFILPQASENSEPSWFGFLISVKENTPFSRNELVKYLNNKKIATRLLFSGNVLKQPYMKDREYRVVEDVKNSNFIMNNTFWIGCYQGINDEMIDYIEKIFAEFIECKTKTL